MLRRGPECFKYRTGRITAPKSGKINNRRSATTPDCLVRYLFQYKTRASKPFQYAEGHRLETVIKVNYVEHWINHGHCELFVEEKDVDQDCAFFAASVDGQASDPSDTGNPSDI